MACPQCGREAAVARAQPLAGANVIVGAASAATWVQAASKH